VVGKGEEKEKEIFPVPYARNRSNDSIVVFLIV
jgi:hypothetical protein